MIINDNNDDSKKHGLSQQAPGACKASQIKPNRKRLHHTHQKASVSQVSQSVEFTKVDKMAHAITLCTIHMH